MASAAIVTGLMESAVKNGFAGVVAQGRVDYVSYLMDFVVRANAVK